MILESASVIGPMHEAYKVANQDFALTSKAGDYDIGIVCDGVSLNSRRQFSNSEIAAQWCAKFLEEYFREKLSGPMETSILETIKDGFKACALGLSDHLNELGIPFYDCQTTVICMLYKQGALYAGIAGDGGILYQCQDGSFGLMISKEKTCAAVSPICDASGWRFLGYEDPKNPVIKAIEATDGIFDTLVIFHNSIPHMDGVKIEELFSIDQIKPDQRKEWLKKQAESIASHDDRTIVVLVSEPNETAK